MFPDDVYTIGSKDVNSYNQTAKFKILTYIDSTSCTSCKMKLDLWNHFLTELDSVYKSDVSFLMYVYSSNYADIQRILRLSDFKYSIFLDKYNHIAQMNLFEEDERFHTFLLDSNNRVIVVGNPVTNTKVACLYKQILQDSLQIDSTDSYSQCRGFLKAPINPIDLGSFQYATPQISKFEIQNKSNNDVIIKELLTSCDCLRIITSKDTIEAGESFEITFSLELENPEKLFSREIFMRTNEPQEYVFRIIGNAL
jgi:uncharacterized protein YqiB (DUF1249 family)